MSFALLFFIWGCHSDYHKLEVEIEGPTRDKALLYLPEDLSSSHQKIPLFVLLHGYGSDRQTMDLQFRLQSALKRKKYAFMAVNGTRDSAGKRFWNASKACCNLDNRPMNDLEYLSQLISKATSNYKLDPAQVFLIGFSNGGFMSYRMACERPDLIKGLISFAGTANEDYESCRPSRPVRILHVHGTDDRVIKINGGVLLKFAPHISAAQITQHWAKWNGCTGQMAISRTPDVTLLTNSSDKVTHFNWDKCKDHSFVEMQVHQNDGHLLIFVPGFIDALIEKLVKNPTPQTP